MLPTKNLLSACAALVLMSACARNGGDDAADQRHFDSLVAKRDTLIQHYQAQQDSVAKVLGLAGRAGINASPAPVRDDSDLTLRPVPSPTAPSGSANVVGPATIAGTTAGTPPRRVPAPRSTVSPITERGVARGDSIARADANKMLGNVGTGVASDSVRGIVQAMGARSMIKTSNKTMVSLSGMATDGIPQLAGADIVVHGLKISSQDMVVKSYVVLSLKGVAVLDGRVDPNGKGWVLTLSNGTGVQRLSGVPPALQAVAGARVWITFAPGTTTPQAFGTIGRR